MRSPARLPASSSRDARKFAAGRRRARAGRVRPGRDRRRRRVRLRDERSVRLRVERSALVAAWTGATGPCPSPTARWPWRARARPRRQVGAAGGDVELRVRRRRVRRDGRRRTGATVALDRGAGAYVVTLVAAATDGREATAVATFEARAADFPRVSVAPRWTATPSSRTRGSLLMRPWMETPARQPTSGRPPGASSTAPASRTSRRRGSPATPSSTAPRRSSRS